MSNDIIKELEKHLELPVIVGPISSNNLMSYEDIVLDKKCRIVIKTNFAVVDILKEDLAV